MYTVMNALELPEFGLWYMRGVMLHRVNDVFVFAYNGHRVIEIYPDDRCFLVVPPNGLTSGVTARWSHLSNDTSFSYTRVRRANGINEYKLTRFKRTRPSHTYHSTGEVVGTTRFEYRLDGTLAVTTPQRIALKDNVKYRAFNRQLKELRAVLVMQIKMHARAEEPSDGVSRGKARQEILAILESDYGIQHYYHDRTAYLLVDKWMQTQDPTFAKHIFMLAFARCYTSATGDEGLLRQVHNILSRAQNYYLRNHCVTIQEIIPGSTNDQQGELQSAD
jgi:hypothetical protein